MVFLAFAPPEWYTAILIQVVSITALTSVTAHAMCAARPHLFFPVH